MIVVVGWFACPVMAEDGVECALEVYQYDSTLRKDILLYSDSVQFVKDIPSSGFLVAFSTEIRVIEVDSNRSAFTVHVVTLGPPGNTYSKSFTVEYGLPAAIRGISGKRAAQYTLAITPLARVNIDTSACAFNHREKGAFRFDPTAHMDIYFVPNSLGDFYWDSIKDLLEQRYRLFKSRFNLNLPGKYNLYLCPCPVSSVIWDDRFGMAVDPTRSTAFAIYSKHANSADPFLVTYTAVLRTFGYAPAFLSEGLANYTSFAIFDMKQILQSGRVLPLSQLLDTYQYFLADPHIADRSSATFVKYLIDQYTFPHFKTLYESADDLSLAEKIEQVYGKRIAALEAEWKNYVDTVTILLEHFGLFAQQAEQMLDYLQMLKYARAFVEQSTTAKDSLWGLHLLVRAYFFTGDYYQATSAQEALMALDTGSARNWMRLAAYKMMNGYYEEARSDLLTALALDSADQMVKFNLALNSLVTGNENDGREILLDVIGNPTPRGGAGGEVRIMLADILRNSEDAVDRASAVAYYNEAIRGYQQELRVHKASPAAHLWLGVAFLGLGDTGNASNHLQTALFLETRPFYLGMINLWLGKVADVLKDRSAAQDFYGKVLSLPSAEYHQKEARMYLDNPYQQ